MRGLMKVGAGDEDEGGDAHQKSEGKSVPVLLIEYQCAVLSFATKVRVKGAHHAPTEGA